MAIDDINDKIRLHLKSAGISIDRNNFDKAVDELKAAEMLDPENPEILFNLGIAYSRQGLSREAEKYFEKIINLKNGSVDKNKVRKLLAYTNILHEEYDSALKYLNDALDFVPGDIEALNMSGYCYEKNKRYQEAIESYKMVVDIDKENLTAMNSLAYIIAETNGDLNKALNYGRKLIAKNENNPAYLDTIGYIYLKRGDKNMARKYIKAAYEKSPLSPEIKKHLNELLGI